MNQEQKNISNTSKLTPFEKLDVVLGYIEKLGIPPYETVSQIRDGLREKGFDFGHSVMELHRILMKLEHDNNIYTEIGSDGIKKYYSNFDGNLFYANGGYVKKQIKDKSDKIFDKIFEIVKPILGVLLGAILGYFLRPSQKEIILNPTILKEIHTIHDTIYLPVNKDTSLIRIVQRK